MTARDMLKIKHIASPFWISSLMVVVYRSCQTLVISVDDLVNFKTLKEENDILFQYELFIEKMLVG